MNATPQPHAADGGEVSDGAEVSDAADAEVTRPRSLYDATGAQLAAVLAGEPAYRVKQLWAGLY